MFPTMYVPTAIFGLTNTGGLPSAPIDGTPLVVAAAVGVLTMVVSRWISARREATPVTPRPRMQPVSRSPITAAV